MPSQVAIILVEPEGPDNIGAVARAVKNMGFSDLRLVRPPAGWKEKGRKMAMRARDILEKAPIFSSVREAVQDCQETVGTTRRFGNHRGNFVPFKKAIRKIQSRPRRHRVAVLFGRESKGLSNRDLALCDFVMTIPSDPAYPSLNLAQAVMVVVFSLSVGKKKGTGQNDDLSPFCAKIEVYETLARFKNALNALGYQNEGGDVVARILATLHGLMKRAGLTESEAQMVRGLSRRILEKTLTAKRG